MATTRYEADELLKVSTESFPLTVSVHIGNGQGGGYLIFKGTDLIGVNRKAVIANLDNVGEWVFITVTIKDKLEETNWTSVTVFVEEHNSRSAIKLGPYSKELENHLDTIIYAIKLKMQLQ